MHIILQYTAVVLSDKIRQEYQKNYVDYETKTG
jgi:hypothetical protein